MKVRVELIGEGSSYTLFEATEEQYKFLKFIESIQGNEMDEGYSPSFCVEIKENK